MYFYNIKFESKKKPRYLIAYDERRKTFRKVRVFYVTSREYACRVRGGMMAVIYAKRQPSYAASHSNRWRIAKRS